MLQKTGNALQRARGGGGWGAVVHVMKISQSLITTDDIRNGAQRVEVFPEQRRHSGAVERLDE